MKNYVYFDLETQRSFRDVGGAANKSKMGVSVAVTYSSQTGEYIVYGEESMDALVDQLIKADCVVGWNHEQFDYPVLEGYTIYDMLSQTRNLDMMLDLEEKLGFRLKLDSAAEACLDMGKTADGLDALRWWQDYLKTGDKAHIMKIAEYCCFDVKVTKCVHEYGLENGIIKYKDKGGSGILDVEVDWK